MTATEKLWVVLVAVVLLAGASQYYPGWADPLFARAGVTVEPDELPLGAGYAVLRSGNCQVGATFSHTGSCTITSSSLSVGEVNGTSIPSSSAVIVATPQRGVK